MKKLKIPDKFYKIKYNGKSIPSAEYMNIEKTGSNCQLFAYSVLHYFGIPMLTFRSSELWKDTELTKRVNKLKPLDLILFNSSGSSYGAHIGLYIGYNEILHLSKEVGKPVVWPIEEFKTQKKYSIIVGIKRVKR